jgi:hypothetical protein
MHFSKRENLEHDICHTYRAIKSSTHSCMHPWWNSDTSYQNTASVGRRNNGTPSVLPPGSSRHHLIRVRSTRADNYTNVTAAHLGRAPTSDVTRDLASDLTRDTQETTILKWNKCKQMVQRPLSWHDAGVTHSMPRHSKQSAEGSTFVTRQ